MIHRATLVEILAGALPAGIVHFGATLDVVTSTLIESPCPSLTDNPPRAMS
jgi:hypothetical protein